MLYVCSLKSPSQLRFFQNVLNLMACSAIWQPAPSMKGDMVVYSRVFLEVGQFASRPFTFMLGVQNRRH
jgi:hypothetical protein